MAEPGGRDMDRNPGEKQRGRVEMPQIMQASIRERLSRVRDLLVVLADQRLRAWAGLLRWS